MKSRMSWLKTAHIGLNGLFSQIPRLVVTVTLAMVALGFLGTAFSASRFDVEAERERVLYRSGEGWIVDFYEYPTESQFAAWEETTGLKAERLASTYNLIPDFEFFTGTEQNGTFCFRSNDAIFSAEESVLNSYGMSVIGRLPEKKDEIALSYCHYLHFEAHGYYDHIACPAEFGDHGLMMDPAYAYTVASPEQFVSGGFRLSLALLDETKINATIVGIVREGECTVEHTADSMSNPTDLFDNVYVSKEFMNLYCDQNYGDGIVATCAVMERTTDESVFHELYQTVENSKAHSFFSMTLNDYDQGKIRLLSTRKFFISAGFALLVFSELLIYQFISFSIDKKRRQIAILRALGATKADVVCIFLTESLLLSVLQAGCGMIAERIFSSVFNAVLRSSMNLPITFVSFYALTPLVILGISVIVSLVSALVPILRTANQSPVDAIRENQQ